VSSFCRPVLIRGYAWIISRGPAVRDTPDRSRVSRTEWDTLDQSRGRLDWLRYPRSIPDCPGLIEKPQTNLGFPGLIEISRTNLGLPGLIVFLLELCVVVGWGSCVLMPPLYSGSILVIAEGRIPPPFVLMRHLNGTLLCRRVRLLGYRTDWDTPDQSRIVRTDWDIPGQSRIDRTHRDAPDQSRIARTDWDTPDQSRIGRTDWLMPDWSRVDLGLPLISRDTWINLGHLSPAKPWK